MSRPWVIRAALLLGLFLGVLAIDACATASSTAPARPLPRRAREVHRAPKARPTRGVAHARHD